MPTYDFPTPKPITLRVQVNYAEVIIEANTEKPNHTVVDVSPKDPSSKYDVDEVGRVTVTQRSEGGDVEVRAPPAGMFGFLTRGTVVIRITLPPGSSIDARNARGRINVRGEVNTVDLDSRDGELEVGRAQRVNARTSNGAVTVWHSASAQVHTNRGRVLVDDCKGDVNASTNDGAVEIVTAQRVEARSNNGRINVGTAERDVKVHTNNGGIDIAFVLHGNVDATTNNGRITVGVARGSAAQVDAKTLSGTVRDNLGEPRDGEGKGEAVRIHAKTNNGGIQLDRADRPAPTPHPPAHEPAASGSSNPGPSVSDDAPPPAYNQEWRSGEAAPGDVANFGPKV